MTTKNDEPIISLSYEKSYDGTYIAHMTVSGLTSESMAKAAVDHMQQLFCGPTVEATE